MLSPVSALGARLASILAARRKSGNGRLFRAARYHNTTSVGKVRRTRGKRGNHLFQQRVETLALERGNRNYLAEIVELAVLLDQRKELGFLTNQVDFIQQQKRFGPGTLQEVESKLVAGIELVGHIHDYQHQVAALKRLAHLNHHLAAEGTVGPVNSWRIDQDNLAAIFALAFTLGT